TGFLAWTTAGLFLSVIPTLLDRAGQNDLAVIGGILGTVLLCSLLAQPTVPVLGLRRAQLSGLMALLVSLILLAFSFSGPTFLIPVAAIAAGIGHGLAYGGASAAVESAVSPEQRGAVTGALYIAFYSGAGVPPVAIGLMTLGLSLGTATALVAAAAATAVPVAVSAVRSARPGSRAVG